MHYPYGHNYLGSIRDQDPHLLDVHARRVTQEPELPLALEDIQEDIRVDSDDDIATIERLADGVCNYLEERTAWAFKVGSYEARLSSWWKGESVKIQKGPYRDGLVISYLSHANTWTDLTDSDFRIIEDGRTFSIRLDKNFTCPALYDDVGGIRIRFNAGFDGETVSGAGAHPIDKGMSTLLMACVAHLYAKREAGRDELRQPNLVLDPFLETYRWRW